ncbi:hypothetical protein F7Q99_07450 [Streptomyces kaniharaensis]|uniref:Uncharacterized protein n=1 Tax=Streptomyces kaniharaensis TaxID=212423 RepID=A0A6N7KR90_9ACTN|nr:hypothetical protein [Streptomyces kaniharaensis]MQS12133.1 hypothetical protein [Streptomyces kaniharaensis]
MRMRPTAPESEQHAHELRAELDELLRASRYAGQRERRLAEAIRASPDRQRPEGDLLRQLAQARTLREGLGARCRQLSDQLQALELDLRQRAQEAPQFATPEPPPLRPDIGALAQRVTALHHSGAHPETAELLTQAAARLTPTDTAHLAGILARGGPSGVSLRLARSAAQTTPELAVAVLVELREAGLAEEAAELFHAFWSYPAHTLPALLAALEHAGQLADGATLLWEWGSAPTPELTALAAGLQHAGRHCDVRTLLRQAAGRPTADLAALAIELPAPLPAALLHELAALRPPAELVRLAAALDGSQELYDHLLAALRADEARHRTTLAALRSAGLPTEPAAASRPRRGRR